MRASALSYDELDQSQLVYSNGTVIPVGRIQVLDTVLTILMAQSFVPTKEVLTRVELYMGKNATASYPLVVGIRDNLTHPDLAQTQLSPDHFTGNLTWIDFDFPDLWVNPGETYFIVASTRNATDNYYGWAAANYSDAYLNGAAYWSTDNGSSWQGAASEVHPQTSVSQGTQQQGGRSNSSFDMCFKTYGLRETTLALALVSSFPILKFSVTNTGNVTAQEPTATVSIKGGVLGGLNHTFSTSQAELQPGESFLLKAGMFFGFGRFTMTVTVYAINAKPSTITQEGVLILFFVIWR
jgi:hypothetical protein